MNLMKALLLLLLVGVLALFYFILPGDQGDKSPRRSAQTSAPSSRADDPTYAEEVSALSARVRAGAASASEEKAKVSSQLGELTQKLKDLTRQTELDARRNDQTLQGKGLTDDIDRQLKNALAPIQQQISALVAGASQTGARNVGGNNNYSSLVGYTKISPFGGNAAFNATNIALQQGNLKEPEPIPVYTLHNASMLSDSVSVTPIIGRVPNGGSVTDPFRFRIVTGGTNLMANGHQVPGVKNAIWAGYAVGVREESCVRGYLDTVSFVFEDGRVVTQTSGKQNQISSSTATSQTLGYLADPYGKPCLTGTLINNASQYLKGQAGAAFLEGMAAAYAQSQTTVRDYGTGGMSSYVDGDVYAYGLGLGISKSAAELADYVRQRSANAFDVVYFPSNQKVQVMIESQIDIDYDPSGRKVAHFNYSGEYDANTSAALD